MFEDGTVVLPTLISYKAVHYITLLPVLNTVCTANREMYAENMSSLKHIQISAISIKR